jgi:tetratricopeptide (TPR) repeat protein
MRQFQLTAFHFTHRRIIMKQALKNIACALALGVAALPSAQAQTGELATRHWQSSLAAESRGALDEAQTHVLAYSNAGGDRYLAALRSGWLAYGRRDYEKAVRYYKAAIEAAPQAITPRLGQMYAARYAGRVTEAIQAGDSVLAIQPAHREASLVLAEMRIARGEAARAVEQLRRVQAEFPEDTTVIAALAGALRAVGRVTEADQMQLRYKVLIAAAPVATQLAR